MTFSILAGWPALRNLVEAQLAFWPEHEGFLAKRFRDRDTDHLAMAEELAGLILRLHPEELGFLCAGYRWMCDRVMEEELHFRRAGSYRVTTFAEAERAIYANREAMTLYMNGLLVSQVLWSNHTDASAWYRRHFLDAAPAGHDHLEVGPGHGLLLYFAASHPRTGSVTAWDVSATSLAATRHTLDHLGVRRPIGLEKRDVLAGTPPEAIFDSIVISEVLEHLEHPREVLKRLRRCLRPGGRIYVNMPINSPAPDHIFLLRQPEEVMAMLEQAGFAIAEHRFFPAVGYTEERARKAGTTISCLAIGIRP